MRTSKVMTAKEAAFHLKDGDTLAIGGSGGGIAEPTDLMIGLEERFLETSSPRGLTFVHVTGLGDREDGGLCHLAYEGLLKRNIGGHYDYIPKIAKLAGDNKIEAYNLPQGVLSQLFRESAAGRPGLLTHVGLRTFVDPRIEGGKLNEITKEELVKVVHFEGQEKLFYPSIPCNAAFLRGTTADEDGNVSMEEEAALLDNLAIAQAVHNNGGKVFVQVKRLVQRGSIHPKMVRIPGILVDGIILSPGQKQTVSSFYNPAFSGEVRIPLAEIPPLPFNERKIIAMRAAKEIPGKKVVNLGVGISASVGLAAKEMGLSPDFVFVVEQGVIGGVPASGIEFGASSNPIAIIDSSAQFDFFDGGGLELACLGMAEVDMSGNVNVSKLGNRIFGCGGFINIAQNAKQLVFCGTFSAGGLQVQVADGQLKILQEGRHNKFVNKVDQITFSGDYARERGQNVLYVTERAVFSLGKEGLVLEEIAPGMDMQNDILAHMPVPPQISDNLRLMDVQLFQEMMGKPMEQGALQ